MSDTDQPREGPRLARGRGGRARALLLALFVAAAALRIGLALRPGLWGDEIFSLAMATGHSLEHPAAEADPAQGDFVEPPDPQPPAAFLRYMRHESLPAGAARVIRAVLLSDTNPPLYYLLLNLWTRVAGTGDGALRLFSAAWALACFPLLWILAERIGGRRAAWSAWALFALAPPSVYYATEGRMYAMVWFLALALAWATLELGRRGARPALLGAWILAGAAGLLTHYFFGFVWLACAAWLAVRPGAGGRLLVVGAALATLVAVMPWYLRLPESLSRWRVTSEWLTVATPWPEALVAPLVLVWSLVSGRGLWGGEPWPDRFTFALFVLLGAHLLRTGRWRGFLQRTSLLWCWALASCLGPSLLDLVRHTDAALISRYALPALPAGILLAAVGVSMLRLRAAAVFLLLVVLSYLPGAWDFGSRALHPGVPYGRANVLLAQWAGPSDVAIVHSIPSGVLGMARYARTTVPIASWVVRLGNRRAPQDMQRLLAGRRGAALIRIHDIEPSSPAEAWLRENARLVRERHWRYEEFRFADLYYFAPAHGEVFFPAAGAAAPVAAGSRR